MPGVTGREVKAAWAKATTWGTAASVTKQVLISSTDGLHAQPALVQDDAFGQDFLGSGEIGDHTPITADLQAQLRFEGIDSWLAMACGSSAATVVSSQAATSLVAASHVMTLAAELTSFMTLAIDKSLHVHELPSVKIRGFSIRVGENGRMQVTFPIVANKAVYDSAINVAATVTGATAAEIGNRVFRKNGRYRMNVADGGALGSGDEVSTIREVVFNYSRPMAQDHVLGSDAIIEPDDDGFMDATLEVTYARMNTVSANSLHVGLLAARRFKGDLYWTGPYINSTTQRSLLVEFPCAQLQEWRAPVTGHNQVRPVGVFRLSRAATSPTGMAFVNPFRVTLVNANSVPLLS